MPRGRHINHKKGSGHYRWNAGKILSSHGYVKVRVGRCHALADPNGYAYEHLIVWVGAGNKTPSKDELIHHKNGDKTDNQLENLELKKRDAHNADHNAERFNRRPLTKDDAAKIRKRRENGELLKSIAASYGIAFQTVSKISRGERWK